MICPIEKFQSYFMYFQPLNWPIKSTCMCPVDNKFFNNQLCSSLLKKNIMLTDHEEDFYVVKTFTFGINFEDRTTNIETKVFECFFAISECLAI